MGWFKRKSEEELLSEIQQLKSKNEKEEKYFKLKHEYNALKNKRLNEFGQRMSRGTSRLGSTVKSLVAAGQQQRVAQRQIAKRKAVKPINYEEEMRRMMMR